MAFSAVTLSAIISVLALCFALWSWFMTRRSRRRIDYRLQVQKLYDRLHDLDKLIFEHPEAQLLIANEAKRKEPYFTDEKVRDREFFHVRAAIYLWVNLFDEAINTLRSDRKLERVYDLQWWESYVLDRMKHPMFKEVFKAQPHHWSNQFGRFLKANKAYLEDEADPRIF